MTNSKNVLKPESMAILPEYNQHGLLCTRVLEENQTFIIEDSPSKLVKNTLSYFLNDLDTAIKGSKSVLGPYRKLPIVICDPLCMYWFPSHSPKNRDCMWFSLEHVKDIEPINKNRCKVNFKNGLSIEVKMKAKLLGQNRDRTSTLKIKMKERTKQSSETKHLLEMGMMYVRELNERYKNNIQENDEDAKK